MAAGQEFDDRIEAELDAAKAVLVVWTPSSTGSRWVRGEAREAAERGVVTKLTPGEAKKLGGDVPLHSAHALTGEIIERSGRRYYATREGLLLRDSSVRVASPRSERAALLSSLSAVR